jgi:hypothetical protein
MGIYRLLVGLRSSSWGRRKIQKVDFQNVS